MVPVSWAMLQFSCRGRCLGVGIPPSMTGVRLFFLDKTAHNGHIVKVSRAWFTLRAGLRGDDHKV
jgi:hypothetical protein